MTPCPRSDVRLSVAIQHHPSRDDALGRLILALIDDVDEASIVDYPGGPCAAHGGPALAWVDDVAMIGLETVPDPDPFGPANPWRTARACWATAPAWATHRLVVQDDAIPCPGFLWAAIEAIRHRPFGVVSFYLGEFRTTDLTRMEACARLGLAWSRLDASQWIPHVATAMPVQLARHLGAYQPTKGDAEIGDDMTMGEWARAFGVEAWQTIPCLVQHDNTVPSTLAGHRKHGRPRHASCWVGDHDARAVDWTRG